MHCNAALIAPTFVTGLILGFIYALIALGYTMVYGVLKLINFAHDAVFATGGILVFYAFGQWFGIVQPLSGVSLVVLMAASLVIGALASAGSAFLLERVAYRPLRRRQGARLSYLITAIGASFFADYLYQQNFLLGPGKREFPNYFNVSKAFTVFGSVVQNVDVLIVVLAIACLIALDQFITRTRSGRAIRALSEDQVAAQLMGINNDRVITTTFVVGGLFAGIAGVLYAIKFGFVVWNMGFVPGIKAFTAAVLGGIGNIRGALLGGILLGLIENMSAVCVGAEWKDTVAFSVLVLVLILRPTGILGEGIKG